MLGLLAILEADPDDIWLVPMCVLLDNCPLEHKQDGKHTWETSWVPYEPPEDGDGEN